MTQPLKVAPPPVKEEPIPLDEVPDAVHDS